MASKNVKDWELPLPSSSTEESDTEEEETAAEKEKQQNKKLLEEYVRSMAYRPVPAPKARPRSEALAKPKPRTLMDNYDTFGNVLDPRLRKDRVKQLMGKYTAITAEQLEAIMKSKQKKEKQKENLNKRKQEIYYKMLTKLENQCREQFLNVLINKFAHFLSNLSTRMHIPKNLAEPYARMHRGLVKNILCAMDISPSDPNVLYYNTPQAKDYEVCHNLAHAILSLIIKALDSAALMDPDDIPQEENQFEMDNYIKDRLMSAAQKKVDLIKKSKYGFKTSKSKQGASMQCGDS